MAMSEESNYQAYMLRLRQVCRDGQPIWLASVESPHTGEHHTFTNLEGLFAFLIHKTGSELAGATGRSRECPRADRKEENQ